MRVWRDCSLPTELPPNKQCDAACQTRVPCDLPEFCQQTLKRTDKVRHSREERP